MPGWHEFTKSIRKNKQLVLLGVIQEQHAERCELFAQWKEFDWPIVHDPLNLIPIRAVPVPIAIDEFGIVRDLRPSSRTLQSRFLTPNFERPKNTIPVQKPQRPDLEKLKVAATAGDSPKAWRELGDALILWTQQHTAAIDAYRKVLALRKNDAPTLFRLGVAYRMRFESSLRKDDDFSNAVRYWGQALEQDPNHYIFRRRIQQYGPRLTKPYPFYDWVDQARNDILARGKKPVALPVDPSGAEIASPSRRFSNNDDGGKSPDPQGKIERDQRLVLVRAVSVPAKVRPGAAVRVHLEFRISQQAHWNNESEPLVVWLDDAPGGVLDRKLIRSALPRAAESKEVRSLEFEFRVGTQQQSDVVLNGYALYYVCENAGGTCLYRRQDFKVTIPVQRKN